MQYYKTQYVENQNLGWVVNMWNQGAPSLRVAFYYRYKKA